jgi:hypothetical protein
MAMSTLFGRSRDKIGDDRREKYCSFHMAVKLHDRFVQKYGSIICCKIQENIFGRSYNLWDEKEKKEFEKAGAHIDKCTTVVADGAAWATELILEEVNRRKLTLNDFSHVIHISNS